ncbi:MAG: M20 family metallo-hydrolase [Bacteroidota bacterium]
MRFSEHSLSRDYSLHAVDLLKLLIATPSLSREEARTAVIVQDFLERRKIQIHRKGNNVWAFNAEFDEQKPSLLLNSHHDTVKANQGYTKDPLKPEITDGKLYGLGSNDAGGCLVSLLFTFLHFYGKPSLPYNLVFLASAEEEISGQNGVALALPELPAIDCGLIGEPTKMEMAVAEKGLIVLDCYAKGKAGHAAREEGENAIYKALHDISWFHDFKFDKVSEFLGPIKMTVTVIEAGKQHNVVPDSCHFVADVRTTDVYSNEETLEIINNHVQSEVKPRSLRLHPSFLPENLPLAKAADLLQIKKYGSPTLSDQSLMDFPTCKIGPGDSARSHTADEFIYLNEIQEGIAGYIQLLTTMFDLKKNTL